MRQVTCHGGPLDEHDVELPNQVIGLGLSEPEGSYVLRDGALHWTAGSAPGSPDPDAEPAPDVEHIRPAAPPAGTRKPS